MLFNQHMKKETIIISLGGSIVVPDKIDTVFLKKFKKLIIGLKNKQIILVVGGGKTARKYIRAADKFNVKNTEKDWIGIMATRINAQLVKAIFSKTAYKEVIYDPTKKKRFDENILVSAGYKPGWSTDYVAALLAKKHNAKYMINLSNIYHVYDKDPRKYKNAKKIEQMSWQDMQKIVGTKWIPGKNIPFDPIATKVCKKNKIKVIITKGTDIANLKKIFTGKRAKCTMIE